MSDIKKAVSDIWHSAEGAESGPLDLEHLIIVGERIAEALEQLAAAQETVEAPEERQGVTMPRAAGFVTRVQAVRNSAGHEGWTLTDAIDLVRAEMRSEQNAAIAQMERQGRANAAIGWHGPLPRTATPDPGVTEVRVPGPARTEYVPRWYREAAGIAANRPNTTMPHRAPEVVPGTFDEINRVSTEALQQELRRMPHRAPEDGPEDDEEVRLDAMDACLTQQQIIDASEDNLIGDDPDDFQVP
jgi:hypothetical protein